MTYKLPYTPAPRQRQRTYKRIPNRARFSPIQAYSIAQQPGNRTSISARNGLSLLLVISSLCIYTALNKPSLSRAETDQIAQSSLEVKPITSIKEARPRTIEMPAPVAVPIKVIQPQVAKPVLAPIATAVVSTHGKGPIKIRLGPGQGYKVFTYLSDGEDAIVLGKSRDGWWWKIRHHNQIGWISSAFVKFSGDAKNVPIIKDQALKYLPSNCPVSIHREHF